MNKITSKYCSIFADNEIRKEFDISFNMPLKDVDKDLNNELKARKMWYQQFIKHKLGKRKYESR